MLTPGFLHHSPPEYQLPEVASFSGNIYGINKVKVAVL